MGDLFARLKIIIRIHILIGIAALGIVGVVLLSSQYIKSALTVESQKQTRYIVETAKNVANEFIARVKSGELKEDEAKKRAIEAISAMRYDDTNYVWINDLDGIMISHPSKEMMGKNVLNITDANGLKIFVTAIELARKGSGSFNYYWKDTDGITKPKISYIYSIPEWNWAVASGIYVNDIQETVWSIEQKLYMAAGFILLIAIGLATSIGNSISRPVGKLNAAMQQLADGDTSGHIGMEERRDEIGEMAKTVKIFQENARQVEKLKADQAEAERRAAIEKKQAMDKMANDFENSVGDIVNVVASAATELQSNAKQLSEMADQTSRQSTTVAAATEEASASVGTVASATEELSASISEINRQVTESSSIAQEAVDAVKHTDATVSTLAEATTHIGDIVKLIQDIAEQTNLLALNATIEAARAGEAGKGFAVVASEVKNLANQTARATDDISQKIITIQGVSSDATKAIRSIGNIIERINSITNAIANSVHEQTAATKEISNNVQQASAGTNEVSSNIINVTHAAKESRGAADEVLEASAELSKQAEHLRAEIQTFLHKVREG